MKKIIIGTRGSKLSLIQTTIVKDLLQALVPNTSIEITTITTSGDTNMSPIPLDTIGKGWFTKEIDKQLLEGKIDIAVHSLKDLLDTLTPGLAITAIPEREDAGEALVSRNGKMLDKLKKGAVIGTDSIRRKIQLLRLRPDLQVKSVRGNVNKRLEKLDSGQYDALLLAIAGLNRLNLQSRITQYFSPKDFIPSPGQGALAVVSSIKNTKLTKILTQLNHAPTVMAVRAEREFSKATGGGCAMPVGAYAMTKGKTLTLYGMLAKEDETNIVIDSSIGSVSDPKGLGQKLAKKMLSQQVRKKYVVLTRPKEENSLLAEKVASIGFTPLVYPSIAFEKKLSTTQTKKYLTDITQCDWIIFTSSTSVAFFMKSMSKLGKSKKDLAHGNIAAVGPKTAETVKSFGLSVAYIPSSFSAKEIAKTLHTIKGKKILLPQSAIAEKNLEETLAAKGAIVTKIPIYTTTYVKNDMTTFKKLLLKKQKIFLTFTSPSTIEGFLKNVDKTFLKKILSSSVISIGPTTTKAAKKFGFKTIHTAKVHTTEGMLQLLQETTAD